MRPQEPAPSVLLRPPGPPGQWGEPRVWGRWGPRWARRAPRHLAASCHAGLSYGLPFSSFFSVIRRFTPTRKVWVFLPPLLSHLQHQERDEGVEGSGRIRCGPQN